MKFAEGVAPDEMEAMKAWDAFVAKCREKGLHPQTLRPQIVFAAGYLARLEAEKRIADTPRCCSLRDGIHDNLCPAVDGGSGAMVRCAKCDKPVPGWGMAYGCCSDCRPVYRIVNWTP